jgi:hypothetical protein
MEILKLLERSLLKNRTLYFQKIRNEGVYRCGINVYALERCQIIVRFDKSAGKYS